MNFDKLVSSKQFKALLIILGELILVLIVFRAGMTVGFSKANFNFKWGENYHRNFGGPPRGWLRDFRRDDFMNANGIVGSVMSATSNALFIKGGDNLEKSVLITGQTSILKQNRSIGINEIQPNDKVVIIGSPSSSGQIEAKIIRIFELNRPK